MSGAELGGKASSSQLSLAAAEKAAAAGAKLASFLPDAAAAAAAAAGAAKAKAQAKSFAVRKWLAVNPRGEVRQLELAKMRVTAGLGVQLRDLRLLDPQLATSYPSAILARERAIVVNLEFIKCIIGMDNVYITNLEDQNTLLFVEELQRRLRAAHTAAEAAASGPSGLFLSQSTVNLASAAAGGPANLGGDGGMPLSSISAAHEELPFELRALEIGLDTVSQYLERLTGDLEAAAHPALDALTGKINTSNLERVRRIKNRMVRLTTRVETLREVLEKFLDDDSDMKDLNLTAKEEERVELFNRHMRSGAATPFDVPLPYTGASGPDGALGEPEAMTPMTPKSASSASSDSTDLEDDPDVAVVEMLMEPYFMQIDNTYNKLQTLCEYIDDTEDYINIELDSHRNALIRLDLVLTSFSASVALVTAITGLFAMNVMLNPGQEGQAPYSWFLAVSISTGIGAIAVFAGVMAYCRWKRLI
ncbi:magnesium transporter MRS2-7 isoform B [Micractinium conductrix]|uniref:Magnesium transporter n=1 Tax=Micractinium conductrix TaxID=554055 RepID=A0A2P6VM16_9CHLO|nr:magnesium transporter MRS2-7 isoform B [Micractinium conductrix]|eukprot:PSC75097.1 magnesium transporter MRS2-7 isoform B [Micractinium conductrix]